MQCAIRTLRRQAGPPPGLRVHRNATPAGPSADFHAGLFGVASCRPRILQALLHFSAHTMPPSVLLCPQVLFYCLDALPILLTFLVFACAHPSYLLPPPASVARQASQYCLLPASPPPCLHARLQITLGLQAANVLYASYNEAVPNPPAQRSYCPGRPPCIQVTCEQAATDPEQGMKAPFFWRSNQLAAQGSDDLLAKAAQQTEQEQHAQQARHDDQFIMRQLEQ